MTTTDWFVLVGVVIVSTLVFPFIVLLTAKLFSYGWAAGQDNFERNKKKKESERGKA